MLRLILLFFSVSRSFNEMAHAPLFHSVSFLTSCSLHRSSGCVGIMDTRQTNCLVSHHYNNAQRLLHELPHLCVCACVCVCKQQTYLRT